MNPARRLGLGIGLSDREADVLRLLAAGASNREIAQTLGITLNTLADKLREAKRKTGAHDRQGLVEWWMAHPNAAKKEETR